MRRARVAAASVLVALVAGCSGSTGSDGAAAPAPTSSTTAASTGPAPVVDGVVPDAVGLTLPVAVERFRAAGVSDIEAVDATGQARLVDDSADWTVSAQALPVGNPVTASERATVFVHRDGEQPKPPGDLGYRPIADVLYRSTGDAADALVADGFTDITFVDFAGKDRPVPADATWTVTVQAPAPGTWVLLPQPVRLEAIPADERPGA